jgi:hypothetical protein
MPLSSHARRLRLSAFALLAAMFVAFAPSALAATNPSVLYDSTPQPLPPNVVSLGFQATQTAEFGDYIAFAGTDRVLDTVTVTMSDWAKHSDYPSMDPAGWAHDITLNIYNVAFVDGEPVVGSSIISVTQSFFIPWRPEHTASCAGDGWLASDSTCYSGLAFNITFDLSSLNQALPDEIIYGIAYNTNTWGYDPLNAPGPYESLNVGLLDTSPSTGTDVEPDAVFWNTMTAGNYTDGGAGGVGTFRRDTNWTPYTPAVRFTATNPPPTSKEQCKNGGWATFNNPTFKNQGQCIQYVNTGH